MPGIGLPVSRLINPHIGVLCVAFVCAGAAPAQSQDSACGSLANAYGPYDYRSEKDKLPIVDINHFTPIVEQLIAGKSGRLGGDLDYTLRAFPNHHRALIAVMKYGAKLQTPQPPDLPRPVECYFDRAIRFKPDDALVRMIYAKFLGDLQRQDEANRQLAAATELARNSAFTQQNIGLIYAEFKQYDQARAAAERTIALGEEPARLIGALRQAGQWRDAPTVPAIPASASTD